jgi:microcystin-dependent protein
MKKIFTIFVVILLSASLFAQSTPQTMSYQAVIRNSSNALVPSTTIGMQISILQKSSTGDPVYIEKHSTTTNANGLATIEIGGGTPVSGRFETIDWPSGPYFVKTETDPTGGLRYSITGTSQLLSVPYALHAKTADNLIGNKMPPFLTINYIIATQGTFPTRDSGSDPGTTLIGEIKMFAGNFAPVGWAFCDGQLLPIAQNTALFSVLGTTYGGNGTTNFMLPDLRGRVSIHAGQGTGLTNRSLGSSGGSE